MKEKQKSLYCLILERLWTREKFLTLLFVIACFVIIEVDTPMMIRYILELFGINTSPLFQKDGFLCVLSVSYVSGVLVYFLTVVLPEIRRSIPILIEIEKSLKYLIDDFFKIANFNNPEDAIDALIEISKKDGKYNDMHYSLNFMNKTLEDIYMSIETLTSHVLSHSPVLTKYELDTLVDIRHRKITQQLKYGYGVENVINESELYDYFENITKLHTDIVELHKNIKNKIYKN